MTRWNRGEATILRQLANRELQVIAGEMTDGQAWLDRGRRTLTTAEAIVDDDPESAFVLAYDAGRQVGTGLLAQQGLRPTTAGGHLAVVKSIVDQFDGPFKELDSLRRRRNDFQYPTFPGDPVDPQEVRAAIATVHEFLSSATMLLPELGFFDR